LPRTLLFCLAHPDDESFSGVGLASWCLARGVRVVLLCATRGEAGKAGDAAVSGAPKDIAAAREKELRDAARIVGIEHVHLLGYRDRELADAPPQEIARKIVARLREYRPQVVVTFDPNGFNRHPDHIAISRFTMDAVAAAADPRWFPDLGLPHRVERVLWTPPLPPWEIARAKDVAGEPGADFVIDISQWREQKAGALRAHRTQHQSVDKHFFDQPDVDRVLARETYRQAWGPVLHQRPSADVFESLIPDP
jgi:N-acetylglucosamine malate deacetylase 2